MKTPCVACTPDQSCPRHTCGGCGRPDWECEGHFKEDRPESKLHVDGTLAAAQRAVELQTENADLHNEIGKMELTIADLRATDLALRTKLAEHETLFAYATHRDDFLEQILAGIGPNLPPYTQRTVDGIVSAVANMALELDAHRDASVPAFDEIVQLCGLAKTWEYPGQVIRDVADSIKRRDDKIAELREQLRVAEAVRDDAREASVRDLERRRDALETAETCREDQRALAKRRDELLATIARLSNTVPFPDEWKDWESTRAKLVAEVGTLRSRVATLEDIAKDEHITAIKRNQAMLTKINELTDQKNGAYTERDRCVAGIAAMAVRLGWSAWLSQHPPDDKWDHDWRTIVFIELPTGQVSWHIHDSEVPWFSFLTEIQKRTWDGHTTPEKYERLDKLREWIDVEAVMGEEKPCLAHTFVGDVCRDCGLVAPRVVVDAAADGQCPWILDDEDPDEGYWHCKHQANHIGVHETEFGKGRDQRWKMRGYLLPGDTSKAQKPPGGPTLGGEDFVGKSPEERRAMIEAVVMGDPICGCSSKYRELAPGVHAKYCQLAGQPL